MMGNRSRLRNFVKKFIRTVRFGNDHFGAIMGYGDYVIDDSVISRVYYVEGLGHNLFFVGQFCDSDLEVAFHKTFMVLPNLAYCVQKLLLYKSYLCIVGFKPFELRNHQYLARKDLVRGLPRLKFEKDHLYSACQLGKSKKYTRKPKSENTIMDVLHTLHMDLCRLIGVPSINGKKCILVIVDDYSRFTWVKFFRSKDETPDFVINVGIFNQKSVLRTPWQNDVVKRQNHTLVEAARIMLTFSKTLIKDLGKLKATTDIGIFIGNAPNRKGPEIILLTPQQISSGLIPDPVPAAPYVPTTNKDLVILFQPMFDEYLEPPSVERPVPPAPAVQVPVVSAGTPSSTTINQDAQSTSHSPSSSEVQPPISHRGVATEPTIEDNPFTQAEDNPFVNVFALEPSFAQS
ncbi:retrovirus-related pol polyprotein from transposon TNT 1-94 [Tanacetum coccineum]